MPANVFALNFIGIVVPAAESGVDHELVDAGAAIGTLVRKRPLEHGLRCARDSNQPCAWPVKLVGE